MKVWHKILVAPVVAIVFLLALGIVSVAMMARQGLAVSQLIKDRGGALELALGAAQDISQAHSGAYRLVMTAGDLGAGAQAAAKAHLARIDAVVGKVNEFRQRPQLVAQERQQLDAVLPQLAGYRKNVEAAMNAAIAAAGDAKTAMQAADAGFEASTATFNALVDIERKMAAESSAQGVADFKIAQEQGRPLLYTLVQMDEPDHMKYRALTQAWFMPQNIRKLEARIRELAGSAASSEIISALMGATFISPSRARTSAVRPG